MSFFYTYFSKTIFHKICLFLVTCPDIRLAPHVTLGLYNLAMDCWNHLFILYLSDEIWLNVVLIIQSAVDSGKILATKQSTWYCSLSSSILSLIGWFTGWVSNSLILWLLLICLGVCINIFSLQQNFVAWDYWTVVMNNLIYFVCLVLVIYLYLIPL
jgi:hypothetical protein